MTTETSGVLNALRPSSMPDGEQRELSRSCRRIGAHYTMDPGMHWITFTSLYPNLALPQHGVFVRSRLGAVLARTAGSAVVVAPVPWFPASIGFGRWSCWARVPRREFDSDLAVPVLHPRYPILPRLSRSIHPSLIQLGAERTIRRLAPSARLIDAQVLYPDGVAAVRLGQRHGLPVILTARGSDVNLLAQQPGPARQLREILPRAAAVVTVSEALRSRLVAATGFPADRIEVIPNCVDAQRFRPGDRLAARQRLGLPIDERIILSVCHLVPGKRVDLLISALAALPLDCRPFLVVVGDGPERIRLLRLTGQLGLERWVRLVGARRPELLPEWYRAADAFALASDREGYPNVLLEAIASGLPVLASAVGGVPEIVNQEVGLVVGANTARAFAESLLAIGQRRFDQRAFQQHAARHTWKAAAERLAAIFERVAAECSFTRSVT
jgi:teichuronic acid biosynthesis glycosyltransferase TuaC